MILTIILYTLLFSTCSAQSVHTMPEAVSRLNWGVMFNRGPTIMNGITKYRHTFEVKVPQLVYTPIVHMKCDTDYLKVLHCEAINDLIDSINGQVEPLITELKTRIATWMNPIPNVDTLTLPETQGRRGRRRREATLGPDYCKKINDPNYEGGGGGGFLSSVGNFFSSLMGSPTWDDIKIIDKHICQLADVVDLNKEKIVQLGTEFATFSKAANNRMDALEDGMKNINTRVTETNLLLEKLSTEVTGALTQLENEIKMSMAGTNLLFRVQKQLYKFQEQINTMSATVEDFGNGINVLLSGRLAPQLVSVDSVKYVIDIISEKLTQQGGETRLVDQNPALYYLLNNVVFTKSEKLNSLYIMASFPIYSIGGLMATYRLDKTYISIKEDVVSSTQIADLPDFLAVTPDGLYYSEFSTSEISSCTGDVIKSCKNERALQSFTQMTCAAALYKDDSTKILELCDIRYDQITVPSTAIKITDDTYMIHSSKVGTGHQWTISCPLIPNYVSTTMDACNACVVQVSCGCELIAPGEFYIPLQLTGCSKVLSSYIPHIEPKFPVNLPVLYAYFDDSVLNEINGDKLLNYKWKLDIPSIAPLEEEWSQSVERSQKYSSSLKKLLEETKANRKVYASKATAMLKKATDFTDLKLSKIKTLSDTFKDLSWLTKFGTGGGIAGVTIGLLLPLLAIVFSCYVFCKRRV
ncbi:ORF68 [Ostreid herpesvirus 1]|nr:ORF68 [Ostreid herpesvirus 1]